MTDLRGINLAMMTPFDESGAIDFKRFKDLIERYLDAGMHGFVFSSGTVQHAYLTEEDCIKLFKAGVARVNGRAKVTAQTSALNMDEVVRRSKTAEDLAVDALMILPPFFEGPRHDAGIFRFYETIDRAVGIDIIGYNIPAATGIFPREAVQLFELIEAGNFAEGLALWKRMIPIVNYIWQNDYIPAAKAAARQMGFDGGTVRAPVCEVGPEAEAKIAQALAPLKAG